MNAFNFPHGQIKLPKPEVGDLWGGFSAMLVAMPLSIAWGVVIYAHFGTSYVAQGVLAGIVGVIALGLIAPLLGGTNRLITSPVASGAAVLSAFAIEFMHGGGKPETTLLMVLMIGILAGLLQILFGALRLGQLIKYMPYPVVSGYLSAVALVIISSQLTKFLGSPRGVSVLKVLVTPDLWQWQSVVVGSITISVMLAAPRITRAIPPIILALATGMLVNFGLGLTNPALFTLEGNPFVVGPLGGGGSFTDNTLGHWQALSDIGFDQFKYLIFPALTLAVQLSIDTLNTCVGLDAMTRTRHNSNRELIGQGIGNIFSAMAGGIPGAGIRGPTLANISSGAVSRFSGFFAGASALTVFLAFGGLISWLPISALAAVLMVIGVRMIDINSFQFLKQRSTRLDFFVVAAVVTSALLGSLIVASGIGIVLAVFLFVREQVGGSVVRRKVGLNQVFSKRVRTHEEMEILVKNGERGVVITLQGSLFFGTTNQLYLALEPELKTRQYVILDMRRIQSIDITVVRMLAQVRGVLAEHHGLLILSQLPLNLPSGRDIEKYFNQLGLLHSKNPMRLFTELNEAIEWVEDLIIRESSLQYDNEELLTLGKFELFTSENEKTLDILAQHIEMRSYQTGDKIFTCGDAGDELFLIGMGNVRIMIPTSEKQSRLVGTFGRGALFGEMAFLDGDIRSADAVAFSDTQLYVIKRKTFDLLIEDHKLLALTIMEGLALVLSNRLRYTNVELQALEA